MNKDELILVLTQRLFPSYSPRDYQQPHPTEITWFQAITGACFCRTHLAGKAYDLDLHKSSALQVRTEIK